MILAADFAFSQKILWQRCCPLFSYCIIGLIGQFFFNIIIENFSFLLISFSSIYFLSLQEWFKQWKTNRKKENKKKKSATNKKMKYKNKTENKKKIVAEIFKKKKTRSAKLKKFFILNSFLFYLRSPSRKNSEQGNCNKQKYEI